MLIYHGIRLYYNKKDTNYKYNPTKCCFFEVGSASFLCIFPTLISNILFAILVTQFTKIPATFCCPLLKCFWILNGFHKLGLHIYSALQSQFHRERVTKFYKILYILCMITPLNDVAFILYISGANIEVPSSVSITSSFKNCNITQIHMLIFIWYGVSDIAIRVYALILFLLPFKDSEANQEIAAWIKRMKIWTLLSIAVSMTATILCYFIIGSTRILYPIDQCFNVFAIVMQFKPVSYKNIHSNVMYYLILIIQCDICNSSNWKNPSRDNNNNNNLAKKNKNSNKQKNADSNNPKNNTQDTGDDDEDKEPENTSMIINNVLFGEGKTLLEFNHSKNNNNNSNNNNDNNNSNDNNDNNNNNNNNDNNNNDSNNINNNNSKDNNSDVQLVSDEQNPAIIIIQ